ncbi:bifunctional riboflavin kinase/FAD synthetase [Thalassobacillus sp. CUG 92003]|uniref:bifunctional riboflavin kinase/FAD synthetase n=1 Tax=Thalassobacillus sp. CUG 92003 TaxID=2736641 RepID=UPI0015E64531|nr:bifunctional riboflavin kinase/FAD synthetase [Thalassobacillus sp. CUG 92003]
MKVIELSYPHNFDKLQFEENVTAVGFFDGVHKGHQHVIQSAISIAKERGMKSAVMTFSPHPSVVLSKDEGHVHYITPIEEKRQILAEMGVDYLWVVKFDEALAQLSPQHFVDHFFLDLNMKHVVAGFDFSFGHKGKGRMDDLPEYASGAISHTVISQVSEDDEKISSTRIRALLDNGDVQKASELLGRLYTVTGQVIEGEKRGRTIGFPTANIKIAEHYYLPKVGVYAVEVNVNGRWLKGMANFGYKPTFHDDMEKPLLEVHIFDFDQTVYGKTMAVRWHRFIREERKFAGIDDLLSHLYQDEKDVREFFVQQES